MRAMLFHNPEAGEADHSRKSLVTLLGKAGLAATYCSTRGPDFSEMLEEKAEPQDFFSIGGLDLKTIASVIDRQQCIITFI